MKKTLATLLLSSALVGCSTGPNSPDGPVLDNFDTYSYIFDQDARRIMQMIDAIQTEDNQGLHVGIATNVALYEREAFGFAPSEQDRQNHAQNNFLFIVARPRIYELLGVPFLPVLIGSTEDALQKNADVLYAPTQDQVQGALGSTMYQDVVFFGHGNWYSYSISSDVHLENSDLELLAQHVPQKTGVAINYHCSPQQYVQVPQPSDLEALLTVLDDGAFVAIVKENDESGVAPTVHLVDMTTRIGPCIEHQVLEHYGVTDLNLVPVPDVPSNQTITALRAQHTVVPLNLYALYNILPESQRHQCMQDVMDVLINLPRVQLFNTIVEPYVTNLGLDYEFVLHDSAGDGIELQITMTPGHQNRYERFVEGQSMLRSEINFANEVYIQLEPFGAPLFNQVRSYNRNITSAIDYYFEPLPPLVE